MQRWYLHELGMSETEAFVEFHFAPPSLRRRIGLLGFIHKRVLGQCHPQVKALIPFDLRDMPRYWPAHDCQVSTGYTEAIEHRQLYDRSLFMYMHIYNRLPQSVVDCQSTKEFQSKLTHLCKENARMGDEHWRNFYEDCGQVLRAFC